MKFDAPEPGDRTLRAEPWRAYSAAARRRLMLVLLLVGACNYADRNLISVVLEPIKREFHASDTMLGLLSGLSFALLYATLGVPIARVADRGDRKHVISWSLIVWSLMTALCGMAANFWQLAFARFGVGAGEAGAVPAAQSLLVDYYRPGRRAWAIGIFTMSSSAGYAAALILGGWVTKNHGWRSAFFLFGLAGLIIAALAHGALKEPRRRTGTIAQDEAPEPLSHTFAALFKKTAYRNLLAGIIIYFLMAYGALVFVVSLMIRLHGLDVAQAGAIFGMVFAGGAVIGSLTGGMLADRVGGADASGLARVAAWGFVGAVPCYLLAFACPTIWWMVPPLLAGTIALTGSVPAAFSAIHAVCGARRRAMAIALAFFFANLVGLGLGPVVAGALSDVLGARLGTGEGLRLALLIMTLTLLPAAWFTFRAARFIPLDRED